MNYQSNNKVSLSSTIILTALAVLCVAASNLVFGSESTKVNATIVFDRNATTVSGVTNELRDLWVTLNDLKKATRFELKPSGVCRDDLCFPLPKAQRDSYVKKEANQTWFNLSAFARMVHQPVAYDDKHSIWLFGERPTVQNGFLSTLVAPNFTLPDIDGKMHSLSDFKGKKVLIVTWASW